MKINVKGWKHEDQVVKIKDRTHVVLANGKRVPTSENMVRQLIKHKV